MDPVRDLELYQGLEAKLGTPVATALMERLPPAPVDQLVTRTDLTDGLYGLRTELKGDIAGLRTELKGDIAGLRTELKGDIAEVRADLTSLEQRMVSGFALVDERFTGMHHELTSMKHELIATMRGEMVAAIHSQGRLMALTLVGSLVGLSGLAFSIASVAS